MFHTDFMYKFSVDYQYEDIQDLLSSFEVTGIKSDDRTRRNFIGLFYSDYLQERINPFSYLSEITTIDIRTLMELRKSTLPRLPIEFYQQHPEPKVGWEKIKEYRTNFLNKKFSQCMEE